MNPNSRSPCADWFRFMKSMSISAHGRSRLNCVWRWSSGFCSALEPGDPHLRRREGVHPCDHADARVRRVRLERHASDRARARGDLLVQRHAPESSGCRVEAGGDLSCVRLDLPQRRRARTSPGSRSRARPRGVRARQAPSLETSSSWLRKLEIISSVSFSSDVSCTGWSMVMRPPCMTLMRSQSSKRWA